jgi:hypothetical protein
LKKLLPYLLLNVIISALTMFLVLVIWNRTHLSVGGISPQDQSVPQVELSATATSALPSLEKPVVEIQAVIIPGDLESERVLIRSVSSITLNLTGWKVSNGKGQDFTFPSLTLFPGGAVALFSRSGQNTANEIFWGLTQAAWSNGAKVTLSDYAGNVRVEYTIP